MTLGQLYRPRGMALETAEVVLQTEDVYAVNVALGCSNGCLYPCYGPRVIKVSRETWMIPRHPIPAAYLKVEKQLKTLKLEGAFISFLTDPFIKENRIPTEKLLRVLLGHGIRVATLSKIGLSVLYKTPKNWDPHIRYGMTVTCLDSMYQATYEPLTLDPKVRIQLLKDYHQDGMFAWISMEPLACPDIWLFDFKALLEEISFVDLIVAGKWNYDKRANTPGARADYQEMFNALRDFSRSNKIRLHIKSGTRKFLCQE